MTLKSIIDKINKKESFSRQELRDIWEGEIEDIDSIYEYSTSIDDIDRWTHSETRIWCINDNTYLSCFAEIANTEMQEDEFFEAPVLVKPHKKLVIETIFSPIDSL